MIHLTCDAPECDVSADVDSLSDAAQLGWSIILLPQFAGRLSVRENGRIEHHEVPIGLSLCPDHLGALVLSRGKILPWTKP